MNVNKSTQQTKIYKINNVLEPQKVDMQITLTSEVGQEPYDMKVNIGEFSLNSIELNLDEASQLYQLLGEVLLDIDYEAAHAE